MATYGWGSDRAVADWLFAEGYRFDFYQAVKLLELLRPDATPVAEGSEPANEPVRFASAVSLAFPASEVAAVHHQAEDGHPPVMTVNFLGLAGARGPLPPVFSELILERLRARDTAMRDFLDIFNHRLVSLLHRVRKTHRVGLAPTPPGQDLVSRCLFALFGMATPGVRGRLHVKDRALLLYTGLLAQQPPSAVGLKAVRRDYFRNPVTRNNSVAAGPPWKQIKSPPSACPARIKGSVAAPSWARGCGIRRAPLRCIWGR